MEPRFFTVEGGLLLGRLSTFGERGLQWSHGFSPWKGVPGTLWYDFDQNASMEPRFFTVEGRLEVRRPDLATSDASMEPRFFTVEGNRAVGEISVDAPSFNGATVFHRGRVYPGC